jgi:hypothetical protein
VDVIDAGEEIAGAFGGDGDIQTGALTEQQYADAADALKMAMDMGGVMGTDDLTAATAADAREALETAGDDWNTRARISECGRLCEFAASPSVEMRSWFHKRAKHTIMSAHSVSARVQ